MVARGKKEVIKLERGNRRGRQARETFSSDRTPSVTRGIGRNLADWQLGNSARPIGRLAGRPAGGEARRRAAENPKMGNNSREF